MAIKGIRGDKKDGGGLTIDRTSFLLNMLKIALDSKNIKLHFLHSFEFHK